MKKVSSFWFFYGIIPCTKYFISIQIRFLASNSSFFLYTNSRTKKKKSYLMQLQSNTHLLQSKLKISINNVKQNRKKYVSTKQYSHRIFQNNFNFFNCFQLFSLQIRQILNFDVFFFLFTVAGVTFTQKDLEQ